LEMKTLWTIPTDVIKRKLGTQIKTSSFFFYLHLLDEVCLFFQKYLD
jgi:hypothetical protein